MANRIIVTNTGNPRSKIFAFTKRLTFPFVGALEKRNNVLTFVNANGSTSTVQAGFKFDPAISTIAEFQAVLSQTIVSACELQITIGPAFYWNDLQDVDTVFESIIKVISLRHLGPDKVEVITQDTGSAHIQIFTGPTVSNLFVLNKPVTASQGEYLFKKSTAGIVSAIAPTDDRAHSLARAILLYPSLTAVRVFGKEIRIDAGVVVENEERPAAVAPDARAYTLAAIKAALYTGEEPAVRFNNAEPQP